MKTSFKNTVRALWRLVIACLAWVLAAVHCAADKASYCLTRRLVDKDTRAAFDRIQAAENNTIDYRQQLVDLLNEENEVIVGMVRERMEETRAGLSVMQHVHGRHPYVVAYPTKQENIQRILNVLDLFPDGGIENAYKVLTRGIRKIHSTGEFGL